MTAFNATLPALIRYLASKWRRSESTSSRPASSTRHCRALLGDYL